MTSAQLNRLTAIHHLPLVDAQNLAEQFARQRHWLLLCAGDPNKYPEANDVAMILPELLKLFPELNGALVAPTAESAFQQHFGFTRLPSLILVRDGQLLGVISDMQNWDDYRQQISVLLNTASQRIPAATL